MQIFSTHRRRMDANRRYRGPEFKSKVRNAANYKRVFEYNPSKWYQGIGGWFRAKGALWRTLGLVGIGVLIYFMVISSSLSVTQVQVEGNSNIPSQKILEVFNEFGNSRAILIRRNNFFLLSQGRINTALSDRIPEIKAIESNRHWPNGITLKVTERNPGFVILSAGSYYLVDDEGIVVKAVEAPDGLLVVEDQLSEEFKSKEMLSTKLAPFMTSMQRQWQEKLSTPIVRAKFPGKASSEVEFVTGAGWSVLFDTARPAAGQLGSLLILLSQQISTRDQERLAYIDLRLSKWAYYCFKASPCEQEALPEEINPETDGVERTEDAN